MGDVGWGVVCDQATCRPSKCAFWCVRGFPRFGFEVCGCRRGMFAAGCGAGLYACIPPSACKRGAHPSACNWALPSARERGAHPRPAGRPHAARPTRPRSRRPAHTGIKSRFQGQVSGPRFQGQVSRSRFQGRVSGSRFQGQSHRFQGPAGSEPPRGPGKGGIIPTFYTPELDMDP